MAGAERARPAAQVVLADRRRLPATLVAWDRTLDLALLKVEARDLPAALIGDSDRLRAGELVLAVGHPFGLIGAVIRGAAAGLQIVAEELTAGRRARIAAEEAARKQPT